MIMQRLHEKDPTGHLLAKGGYVHLMLPSRFEPKRRSVTVLMDVERWRDPRQEAGELLFPQLYTPKVLDEAEKKDLGSWGFAAQHQQSPLPSTGGIFQKGYFVGGEVETPNGKKLVPDRTYRRAQLPIYFDEHIQSWDLAFKKNDDSDFVVGQVWSRYGADIYLRFERRGRMGFAETKQAITDTSAAYEYAHAKLIEDKANGPAIIEELRTSLPGVIAVPNNDGVEAHAWAIQPFVEAGNIHLPHASEWPEVEEWLAEVCGYPKAVHDDRVAAFTQAVLRLMKNIGHRSRPTGDAGAPSEVGQIVRQERW
jgi:predicted phage terminase large subunit-like protein